MSSNFFTFMMDFLAEFMINFKLLSFKKVMANKFEGHIQAEVQQETRIEVPRMMKGFDEDDDR